MCSDYYSYTCGYGKLGCQNKLAATVIRCGNDAGISSDDASYQFAFLLGFIISSYSMHAVTDVHCWYYIHSECSFCVYSYLATFDVVTGLLFPSCAVCKIMLCVSFSKMN
jgi:hypothetical protein